MVLGQRRILKSTMGLFTSVYSSSIQNRNGTFVIPLQKSKGIITKTEVNNALPNPK